MTKSTQRVVTPQDAHGAWSTEDSEDYYIPTYDVTQYKSWNDDPAAEMYNRALESCWTHESDSE